MRVIHKVPPATKNSNPRTTENTCPYELNGHLNPVHRTRQLFT